MIDWFWLWIFTCVQLLVVWPYVLYIYMLPEAWSHLCILCHGLLLIGYISWTPFESKAFRQFWGWKRFVHEYFQFHIKGPGAWIVDPTRKWGPNEQYIFAVHPHGVYASMVSYWALSPHLLHCRGVGSSLLFYIPLVKELVSLAGVIRANRQDIIAALECGESVVITPGGLQEILTRQDVYTQHKGFLKIGHATQVPIVPVYAKGVSELYQVWLIWPWLQRVCLHVFLYPLYVGSWGNPWVPFWPKRLPDGITLSIGQPMNVSSPNADIEESSTQFYKTLETLY